ncbi:MAG: hypothetical protein ACFFG0_34660 [Candidatus Thorarchaeota archaeon]
MDFKHKSQYLYQNLKDILSQNYKNNEEITATFHIETKSGLSEASIINQVLVKSIINKFSDLIDESKNSLRFIIRKQGDNILNEVEFNAFVANITFYSVMLMHLYSSVPVLQAI